MASLAACASGGTSTRVGDLGRPVTAEQAAFDPVPGYTVRSSTPAFGKTDDEQSMEDHVWRFLHAPRARGWYVPRLPQDPKPGEAADRARYFHWLERTDFRSSKTRYDTIAGDVRADLLTLPATFDSVCSVEDLDRRRGIALRNLGTAEASVIDRVAQRAAENTTTIDSFVEALGYRSANYSYALDQLLIATPDESAVEVDALLRQLDPYVRRADAGDFCASTSTAVVIVR